MKRHFYRRITNSDPVTPLSLRWRLTIGIAVGLYILYAIASSPA